MLRDELSWIDSTGFGGVGGLPAGAAFLKLLLFELFMVVDLSEVLLFELLTVVTCAGPAVGTVGAASRLTFSPCVTVGVRIELASLGATGRASGAQGLVDPVDAPSTQGDAGSVVALLNELLLFELFTVVAAIAALAARNDAIANSEIMRFIDVSFVIALPFLRAKRRSSGHESHLPSPAYKVRQQQVLASGHVTARSLSRSRER